MTASRPPLTLSVVIPIHNEATILEQAVSDLVKQLDQLDPGPFEIILAENGSSDGTIDLCQQLSERFSQVRFFSSDQPNYGYALKQGIRSAIGELVVCDEIDLCDMAFYQPALQLLKAESCQMVVASKLLKGSQDNRGWYRHTASIIINLLLRLGTGFRGTDTHGLKAFRRADVLPVVDACVVDKDLFASELVIRGERDQRVRVTEIPYQVNEKRPPSINLLRRVPNVLKNLVRLTILFRFNRK